MQEEAVGELRVVGLVGRDGAREQQADLVHALDVRAGVAVLGLDRGGEGADGVEVGELELAGAAQLAGEARAHVRGVDLELGLLEAALGDVAGDDRDRRVPAARAAAEVGERDRDLERRAVRPAPDGCVLARRLARRGRREPRDRLVAQVERHHRKDEPDSLLLGVAEHAVRGRAPPADAALRIDFAHCGFEHEPPGSILDR